VAVGSPAASRVVSAEDREQPVPWVLWVATRATGTVWTVPSGSTTELSAPAPVR
jgi:hypothetical protein